jgi:hypothetical protein
MKLKNNNMGLKILIIFLSLIININCKKVKYDDIDCNYIDCDYIEYDDIEYIYFTVEPINNIETFKTIFITTTDIITDKTNTITTSPITLKTTTDIISTLEKTNVFTNTIYLTETINNEITDLKTLNYTNTIYLTNTEISLSTIIESNIIENTIYLTNIETDFVTETLTTSVITPTTIITTDILISTLPITKTAVIAPLLPNGYCQVGCFEYSSYFNGVNFFPIEIVHALVGNNFTYQNCLNLCNDNAPSFIYFSLFDTPDIGYTCTCYSSSYIQNPTNIQCELSSIPADDGNYYFIGNDNGTINPSGSEFVLTKC